MASNRSGWQGEAVPGEVSDEELLGLFQSEPERAWDIFIDRYAGLVLSTLGGMGFGHDEGMDRFVHVCEKLCEGGFRRLRTIRFAGERGELVPWIRTVVRNLSVSWVWSQDGRRRLFRSIEELPAREQRVFELYFWKGLRPSEVFEHLRLEEQRDLRPGEVYDALESIFAHLNGNQRWRLMSQLMRSRGAVSIASEDPRTHLAFEPIDGGADPEEDTLRQERRRRVAGALEELGVKDRLILHLRYEEAMTLKEVASIVRLSLSAVKVSLGASLDRLREAVRDMAPEDGRASKAEEP